MKAFNLGQRVRYWAGAKVGEPTGTAEIISEVILFGGTKCQRIRKDRGGSDYLALTHLEAAPSTGLPTSEHIPGLEVRDAYDLLTPKERQEFREKMKADDLVRRKGRPF